MYSNIYSKKNKKSLRNLIIIALLACTVLSGCGEENPADIEEVYARTDVDIMVDTSIIDYETSVEDTEEQEPAEEVYPDGIVPGTVEEIALDPSWMYADFSEINTGSAVLYRAPGDRNGIVIGVNAGHGTEGGTSVKTYCHPDMSPKVTGGTTAAGSTKAVAVSTGMSFKDGTPEANVTLREAQLLRDLLLEKGFDVLMLRDGEDVQLDNVARTVICNNIANCHIAIHWDGDNLNYDKGCFYISTPDGIKNMEPVKGMYQMSENLGQLLIDGLRNQEVKISGSGSMAVDLTQTSFSTVPSVDIELGNAASVHDDDTLLKLAQGMAAGVEIFFGGNE